MDANKKPKKSAELMTLSDGKPASNKQLEVANIKQDKRLGRAKSSPQVHFSTKNNSYLKNPYKMPVDTDIFELRDKERSAKKLERAEQRKLKVYEKTTYTQKIKTRTRIMTKEEIMDEDEDKLPAVEDYPNFNATFVHDRKIGKETLNEYISKKREMFRVQYAIGVMHAEMRKLDEIAQAEERKLEMAEQYLEEDASTFDEFLKENDKNSVEAVKIAEQETKEKLEKVAEIKKINTTIMSLRSDISKSEDTLKEYKLYKTFLESLSPKEWKEKLHQKRIARKKKKQEEARKSSSRSGSGFMARFKGKTSSRRDSTMSTPIHKLTSDSESVTSSVDDNLSDSDEEQELYFSEPQQVLDIFGELEEQNLSLIQNSQETEVALEEVQQAFRDNQLKMENESRLLQEQINKVKAKIKNEQEKSAELETKVKMFSTTGDAQVEDQQALLNELNKKVEQVYRGIIGSNEANIDTLQMLNNIENRLEELFELVESMPPDKVETAKKAKEKERRLKMKEEKLKLLRQHQEERIKKSLERAKAEPKKITGKKLMFRSEPPRMKKKQDKKLDHTSREEEEYAYFFTA